jgi:membrane associated rhomboid family serine protease
VAAYVAVALLDRTGLMSRGRIVTFLGLSYDGVVRHLWIHQFVTAALLHGGIAHLLFNMLSLWMLGPDVERQLGRGRYFLLSLLCAVSGFAGFLLFDWQGSAVAIGYSGVIFGIMVAQAFFFPNNAVYIFAVFPLKMKHAVILMGAIELYLTISPEGGGVANVAHLFGAIAAFAYLKLARMNWRWRRSADTNPVPPSHTGHLTPFSRDWGQPGAMIAEATRNVASGEYAAARRCLTRAHVPWVLCRVVQAIKGLITLSEQWRLNASDHARDKLERQVVTVWDMLVRKEVFVGLRPLADVGLQCGGRIVSLLVDALCNPALSGMPAVIRQGLEGAVAETGAAGVEAVIVKMVDAATAADVADRLLVLLPALEPQRHVSIFMRFYGQLAAEARTRLLDHLASMKDNAAGALCDLLAGALNHMPPDLRLAREVQKHVGINDLERIAGRWAAGGHRGARTVLERLYDYPASAFAR